MLARRRAALLLWRRRRAAVVVVVFLATERVGRDGFSLEVDWLARMKADGTLELDLRGPGGAEARKVYPPTHAEYKLSQAGKAVSIRVETKTYTVVNERGIP